jgi:hypothetical protein
MRGPEFQRPSPKTIEILSKGSTASYTTTFLAPTLCWTKTRSLVHNVETNRGDITRANLRKTAYLIQSTP